MASRAATYCRSEKTSVTLSFTPVAASSSRAASPPDVAVVAFGRFPGRLEHGLGVLHELVGDRPGDCLVVELLGEELFQAIVEAAGLDQVGNDDRVGRGPGSAVGPVALDFVGIDRIEPKL